MAYVLWSFGETYSPEQVDVCRAYIAPYEPRFVFSGLDQDAVPGQIHPTLRDAIAALEPGDWLLAASFRRLTGFVNVGAMILREVFARDAGIKTVDGFSVRREDETAGQLLERWESPSWPVTRRLS